MNLKPIPVDSLAVEMVLELVNEHADVTRLAADENDDPYPILEWAGPLEADIHDRVGVANELYAIVAEPATARAALNDLADRIGLAHRLDASSGLVWTRPTGANSLRAAAAACLIEFVADRGTESFGLCGESHCEDLFVDRSQAQARVYCSTRCNNRQRGARWRARHSTKRPPADDRAS